MKIIDWTPEKLKKEALQCKTKGEFRKKYPDARYVARKLGIWKEITAHMPDTVCKGKAPQNKRWFSINDILPFSSQCTTRTEFYNRFPKAYQGAKDLGVLDEACIHMPKDASIGKTPHNKKWNQENIKQEALKYTTRTQFARKASTAYALAKKLNILDEICKHMSKQNTGVRKKLYNSKWTKEKIIEKAKKYSTRNELRKNEPDVYNAAYKRNILDEICTHMKKSNNISLSENDLFEIIKSKFAKTQRLRDSKVKIYNKPHIKGFDIDIYIPELRKGIEFDGDYWHSVEGLKRSREHWPEEDLKNYSKIKDEWFLSSKGIEIFHIKEEDWNIDKQACIDRCLIFLGIAIEKAA